MEERKRIIYIILVMSALVFCIGIFSNILLFRTYFEETRNRLVDTVEILSHLIEFQSDIRQGAIPADWAENHHNHFSEQIHKAIGQYERHNRKIEITVAKRKGDEIHFIAALRHRGHAKHPDSVAVDSGLAEPMRRALEGKSGTMTGKDYLGTEVLAAYEYMPGLKLGVVVKMDMAEIGRPFIRAGLIIIAVSVLIIFLGIVAISRISNPIIADLEKKADSLTGANEDLARANEEMDGANEELQAAMEEMEQTNEELIRSQTELAQSENRTRVLLEVSPIGIITADRETRRFVYANPSACAMFGYSCDEMLTRGMADIHPAGELEMVIAEFQALADNKYKSTHEVPCLKKDGTLFYADISAAPVEFDGRSCLLGQFIDVTERKRAGEELRESEEQFAKAFHFSPISIAISSVQDGRYIDVNKQFLVLTGYDRDEVIGRSSADLDLWVDKGDEGGIHGDLAVEGILHDRQVKIRNKRGNILTVLYSAVNFTIRGVPHVIKSVVDITERKRAEESLGNSEERYRRITESIADYIYSVQIKDGKPGRTVHGTACHVVTGYTADELNNDQYLWFTMVHPDDRQTVRNHVDKILKENWTGSIEHRISRKDGTVRWVRNTPVLYHDARGSLIAYDGIIVDITERREAEVALRESEEKFAKAFMNAPVLMSISSIEDGTILDVNNQFVEQSGFGRDELIGRTTVGIGWVRPGDRDHYREKVERNGIANGMDLTVYPKGGGPRKVIYYGDSVTIGGEKRLLSIAADVTDWKRAEDDLRRQKELAQMYLDIAAVIIVAIGADQKVSLINRKGCEILGYPVEQIVGRNWIDVFIPEKLREVVRIGFSQIMTGEMTGVEYFENPVLTASGSERLIAWHNIPVKDASGAITGTLSSGEDITERKKSEDDLHNQLALNMALAGISGSVISRSFTMPEMAYMVLEYARLLSDSTDGFVSEIDPDNGDNIALALSHIFGTPSAVKEGVVIFKKESDGLYPGLPGHALNTRREFFTNDPENHPEFKGLPDEHVKITRFLSVPVLFGSTLVGQIALANSVRDYTDDDLTMARRLGSIYALAIVRIRNDTLLVKSLEEKTVLIKELHHRVKNNMQVISSLISLQARKIDDAKYRDIFMESSNRIQAMAMIHEKIYHSGDMARVDFSRYVREIAERLLASYSLQQGQVRLEVDVRDIFLGIDEAVPCGIIINELVTNALKHAFPDGRLGRLVISFLKNSSGKHSLVVRDDGRGIQGDILESRGTSLGMQIVTALVRQLNGTISASGEDGTRIEIIF